MNKKGKHTSVTHPSISQLINKYRCSIWKMVFKSFLVCVNIKNVCHIQAKRKYSKNESVWCNMQKKRKIEMKNPYARIKCHYQKIAVIRKEREREIENIYVWVFGCFVCFKWKISLEKQCEIQNQKRGGEHEKNKENKCWQKQRKNSVPSTNRT